MGAGAVLLQEATSLEHQVLYSTIEKETLALLWPHQHFEVYVGSCPMPVIVFTDHNLLGFLRRMFDQNQRLMWWAQILQDYHIDIQHKKEQRMWLLMRCLD